MIFRLSHWLKFNQIKRHVILFFKKKLGKTACCPSQLQQKINKDQVVWPYQERPAHGLDEMGQT
jgi:hypothetical protein